MEAHNEVSSSTRRTRPFRVAVEGNIGSGKSTFLEYCKLQPDVEVVPEPVREWTNLRGTNLLANYYADPNRWSMAFQSYVHLTTIRNHLRDSEKLLKITERSIYSSRYCFVQSMLDNGQLLPGMAAVLQEWHDFAEGTFDIRPHAIVYIATTPSVAYERMTRRARGEETTIAYGGYLVQLDHLHNEWITREHDAMMTEETTSTTVFTLDGDLPLEELKRHYEDCLGNLRLLTL